METLPDFTQPWMFVALVLLMFAVITGRYFVVAALFQLCFYHWFARHWRQHRLASRQVPRRQFVQEVKWSVITSGLFAVAAAATVVLWQQGHTKVYLSPAQYGWWYLPVSLVASLLIHETYYYFLHRWMHRPAVFRLIHKTHHNSRVTSAWTAFSFHPAEGLLQAVILPLTLMVLPMYIWVIVVQLVIMSVTSVVNHLEIEVYPAWFQRHWLLRWLIGATHHSLHHKQFKYNFGLYFTFWDKWGRTESPSINNQASA